MAGIYKIAQPIFFAFVAMIVLSWRGTKAIDSCGHNFKILCDDKELCGPNEKTKNQPETKEKSSWKPTWGCDEKELCGPNEKTKNQPENKEKSSWKPTWGNIIPDSNCQFDLNRESPKLGCDEDEICSPIGSSLTWGWFCGVVPSDHKGEPVMYDRCDKKRCEDFDKPKCW